MPLPPMSQSSGPLDSVSHAATVGNSSAPGLALSADLRSGPTLSDDLSHHVDPSADPAPLEQKGVDLQNDYWDWNIKDMVRRCHINLRDELWQEKPELNSVAPFALHIRDTRLLDEQHHPGETHIQMYRWDTHSLPVLSEPWKGETWFWSTHLSKRDIFRNILKHSFCSIPPRLLRQAWKSQSAPYHVHLQVCDLLEHREQSTTLAPKDTWHPRSQGGPGQCIAQHQFCPQRRDESIRVGAEDGGGAEVPLQGGNGKDYSSPVSSPAIDHVEQARDVGSGSQTWAHLDSQGHQGGDFVWPSHSLGRTMPTGSQRPDITISEDDLTREVDVHTNNGYAEQENQSSRRALGTCGGHTHGGITTGGSDSGNSLGRAVGAGSFDASCSATPVPRHGTQGSAKSQGISPEEVIYAGLMQHHRGTLSKAHRMSLLESLDEYHSFVSDVHSISSHVGKSPIMLEVFAGSMNLSRVAAKRGWKVLQPVDISIDGTDLTQPKHQHEIDQVIHTWKPDFVSWAPPCGPYSRLQKIMPRDPRRRFLKMWRLKQKRKHCDKLWHYCLKHVKQTKDIKQKRWNDGQILHLVENPAGSEAWNRFKIHGTHAIVDQCRFGLRVRKHGLKVRKRTRLHINQEQCAKNLAAKCQCPKPSSGPRHDHIIAGDKIGNRWIQRSSRCGAWPNDFCHHILNTIEQFVDFSPSSKPLLCYEVLEVAEEEQSLQQVFGPVDESGTRSKAQQQVQDLAYRLHCKYGHPANSTLARALRLGGATDELIDAAKQIRCSTCDRVRAPKEPPKVGTCRADEFNKVVGIDIFWVQLPHSTHMVLSMVDHATSFHVLRLVPHRSPKEVSALFHEAWIGVFGSPHQLIYDQGSEFLSDFESLLEAFGVLGTVIPVETHWKGGVVERHGAIVKTIIRRLVDVHSVTGIEELRCALQEAASAKNSLSKRNGFSPLQWVFGYDDAIAGSVLDKPDNLAIHDHLQSGGKFALKWNMRETARTTWLQLDNSNRMRRAILSRPRQQKERFLSGETVYFYHLQHAGKPGQARTDNPQCWHGPAIVIAYQGPSMLWVSWKRTMLKVPCENVRAATEEEVVGHEIVQTELEDHQKQLNTHGSKARGFLDLSSTPSPPVPEDVVPLKGSQQVTPEEVPLMGRRRCLFKRPPPEGFYEEQKAVEPASKVIVQEDIPEASETDMPQVDPEVEPILGEAPVTSSQPLEGTDLIPSPALDSQDLIQSQPQLTVENLQTDFSDQLMPEPVGSAEGESRVEPADMSEDDDTYMSPPIPFRDEVSYGKHEDFGFSLKHDSTYGPLPTWKDHVQERQSHRERTAAHTGNQLSKFGRMLKKNRKPEPIDVFMAEMRCLQELETQTDETETGSDLKATFQIHDCQMCGCKHQRVVLTAGVTEPVDRDHLPATRAASKTAKEYKWKSMSPNEQTEFRKAMDKEWKSFLDLSAVKIIRKKDTHSIPSNRVLPTRFILTNKDDSGSGLICKARLVCGGHLDPDITLLRTDAPTADTLGVNLVFLFAASNKWVLQAGDVTTAFLSGVYDNRSLYLKPPKEGLPGIDQDDLLEMQKGVYGLCNAPRLWWRRLREVLVS